jgi:hypothetical protein
MKGVYQGDAIPDFGLADDKIRFCFFDCTMLAGSFSLNRACLQAVSTLDTQPSASAELRCSNKTQIHLHSLHSADSCKISY